MKGVADNVDKEQAIELARMNATRDAANELNKAGKKTVKKKD